MATVFLTGINIAFNTQSDKDGDTLLHVFIKNRSNTSSTPEEDTSYIANHLAYDTYNDPSYAGINPYLGRLENALFGTAFGPGSSYTVNIGLRSTPVPLEEIVLPVVNIHILANGNDTWRFDYTITFQFSDESYNHTFSSNTNGVTGITLDQDNRDYSGICEEIPGNPPPQVVPQPVDSALTNVTLTFYTHNDNKDADTEVDIHIVNRLSSSVSQDILVSKNICTQELAAPSTWSIDFEILPSLATPLQAIVLPVVNIIITPHGGLGHDTWIFDYMVTYGFSYSDSDLGIQGSEALQFSSTTRGIVLDQDCTKHTSVYNGSSFPTLAPVGAKLSGPAIDRTAPPKKITAALLKQKLGEFINSRQSTDPTSPTAALWRLLLTNTGIVADGLPSTDPASYYNLRAIDANPPPPGTVLSPGYVESVKWDDSVSDLGPLSASFRGIGAFFYLDDINSNSITLEYTPATATPLVLLVGFEIDPNGPPEVVGLGESGVATTTKFIKFSIQVSLTLGLDPTKQRIDAMSWVEDLENPNNLTWTATPGSAQTGVVTGHFLGQPVSIPADSLDLGKNELKDQVLLVTLITPNADDFGGTIRQKIRDKIYGNLSQADYLTHLSGRDQLNSMFNSWLLGGLAEDTSGGIIPSGQNRCNVQEIGYSGDDFFVYYAGPRTSYQFDTPADWPAGVDFTPGALSNIDHIVVLTMENRSFDQMLGYLSLPTENGGAGRTDIDGLTSTPQTNTWNGTTYAATPFQTGETVFAPDPPHSTEPVQYAIDNGTMDRFVAAYGQAGGPAVAGNIMKYHTAANVPTYDLLARDFAICDRWFAPHPGPTFCNRFYELTGRLNIDPYGFWELANSSPKRPVFTDTIFDHLTEAGVSWKYFESAYCFLRFFERHTFEDTNIATFDDPIFGLAHVAQSGNLPSVTFIDPHFIELPPGGNCDGPPADISQGQALVRQVVETIVGSPSWSKTLLIITYDEHGGFYDHVAPHSTDPVAPGLPTTSGVRVPTFIVSPWVQAGSVFGNDAPQQVGGNALYFDHTSILKTIAKRFLGCNPPYMGPRYAAANDLSSIIQKTPRTGFRPFIPYTLLYIKSQKCLDVPGASTAAGIPLWQFDPNGTNAQQFSFEDAGDGLFYIRTHTSSMYVTVDAPAPGAPAAPLAVKQDVKYPANGTGSQNPAYQKWGFSQGIGGITRAGDQFTVSCPAFPDNVLHPSGESVNSEAAVVLDAVAPLVFTENQDAWKVTSSAIIDTSGDDGGNPTGPVGISTIFDLNGAWAYEGVAGPVITVTGNSISIDLSASKRPTASGLILGNACIWVDFPDYTVNTFTGKLQLPNVIAWSNNTQWTKV